VTANKETGMEIALTEGCRDRRKTHAGLRTLSQTDGGGI